MSKGASISARRGLRRALVFALGAVTVSMLAGAVTLFWGLAKVDAAAPDDKERMSAQASDSAMTCLVAGGVVAFLTVPVSVLFAVREARARAASPVD